MIEDRDFFRISVRVWDTGARVQVHLLSPGLYGFVNVRGYLAADNRTDKSHEPLRLAKFPAADCLHHHHKYVMDLVVQFLDPQLAAQIEANAFGE